MWALLNLFLHNSTFFQALFYNPLTRKSLFSEGCWGTHSQVTNPHFFFIIYGSRILLKLEHFSLSLAGRTFLKLWSANTSRTISVSYICVIWGLLFFLSLAFSILLLGSRVVAITLVLLVTMGVTSVVLRRGIMLSWRVCILFRVAWHISFKRVCSWSKN